MMRLLLDENISPAIVPELWAEGADATCARDRGFLEAEDHVIFRFAVRENRTIVTINGKHFVKIVAREISHPGIVVIPSGGHRAEQLAHIKAAMTWARQNVFVPGFTNHVVDVMEDGTVSVQELRAGQVVVQPTQKIART